jgi:tetratricopeptide (TPR) repeat protein
MVQYALGDLLRRRGRRVEAEGLFKVLARRHGHSPWGHRGLGDLQVEEQPVRAVEHYAEAVRLDPATPIPGYDYLLGVAALRAGDLSTARTRLQRAVAAEPDNARYWCDLGAVAFYEGQLEAAIRFTRRSLEREPGHPGFLHNLATYERAGFRKRPWDLGALWRSWRLGRRARQGAAQGWRKDLWKPDPEPPRAAPPPAGPEPSDPPAPGTSENS